MCTYKVYFAHIIVLFLFTFAIADAQIHYVEDDAPNDPGPNDKFLSDPLEDGSLQHPFDEIQEAVDVALDGDTIIVLDGTYWENITITDKDITITTPDPNETYELSNTIIDGQQLGSVMTIIDSNSIIEGFTITHGLAESGGGINCQTSNLELNKCIITNNNTLNGFDVSEGNAGDGGEGGGIYCNFSSLLINGSLISYNQSGTGGYVTGDWTHSGNGGKGGNGAGICLYSSTTEIYNSQINNNSAGNGGYAGWYDGLGGSGGYGGGIFACPSSSLSLFGCSIEANHAGNGGNGCAGLGGHGGGVYASNLVLHICLINNNSAGSGGNSYAGPCDEPTPGASGGGIYCLSSAEIKECDIINNSAGNTGMGYYGVAPGGSGGGVFFSGSTMIIEYCMIANNTSGEGSYSFRGGDGGDGAGIFSSPFSLLIVSNSQILGNTTGYGGVGDTIQGGQGGDGAGIFTDSHIILKHVIFSGNMTGNGGWISYNNQYSGGGNGGSGGGLWALSAEVQNCIFSCNKTGNGGDILSPKFPTGYPPGDGGDGAGLYCSTSIITNCTVANNNTGSGGIVRNGLGTNGLAGEGAGIYIDSNTAVTNTIIWNNSLDQLFGHDCANVRFCDIGDGICSGINGNISTDPLFADPNNGDFHLLSQAGRWDPNQMAWVYDDITSPCIDAGDPNSDWTGELWPHGRRINMGAYGGTPEASKSPSMAGNIADLSLDNCVGLEDLMLFVEKWLVQDVLLAADMDLNNRVDLIDFSIFSENWLFCWDQDLVGHWQFNETEGDLAHDSSLYANHGTLTNGPVWTGTGELQFDGLNDYVEVPDSSSLAFSNQITISLWIKLTENNDRFMKILIQPSFVTSTEPWENYCIDLRKKNPRFSISSGIPGTWYGCFDTSYSSPLQVGVWYHLAGTYDGSVMTLYVNGQPTQNRPVSLMIGNNDLPVCIGGRWNTDGFPGLIDEVRIYNRALDAAEIQNLYQSH